MSALSSENTHVKRDAPLFTIGYEGAEIDVFVDLLKDAGITTVIDVREAPFSRKRAFSKSVLKAHLADAGIDYCHLRPLGNPKRGRDAAKAGDIATYREIYEQHLATPLAQEALSEAAAITVAKRACLLCLEGDPQRCHRMIVAQHLADRTGLDIEHLRLDGQGSFNV